MQSDEELMLAYREGDAPAFEALVRRHRTRVFGLLRRLLKDDARAEEALADTFFKLHRAAANYQPRASFSTFLFAIAWRTAISSLRSGRHREDNAPRSAPDGRSAPVDTAHASDPEARAVARQELRAVDRMLEQRSELEQAVFRLYYREGLDTGEIAAALELPAGSVRTYLAETRKGLREALEAEALSSKKPMMARR